MSVLERSGHGCETECFLPELRRLGPAYKEDRGMLVLSRKVNERIKIGDQIWVRVVEIRGNGLVRLGIEAPREMAVHREEVVERAEAKAE